MDRHVAGVVLIDVVPDPDAERARAYLSRLESRVTKWDWALVENILAQACSLRAAAAGLRVPIALVRGERRLETMAQRLGIAC